MTNSHDTDLNQPIKYQKATPIKEDFEREQTTNASLHEHRTVTTFKKEGTISLRYAPREPRTESDNPTIS